MATQSIAVAILCLLLASCGSGSGSSDSTGTTSPPPSQGGSPPTTSPGVFGLVEDQTTSLLGLDANNNGVRDDVDGLIARDYSSSPTVARAATQNARAVQSMLTATSAETASIAGAALRRSIRCIWREVPEAELARASREKMAIQLESMSVNTIERLQAYMATTKLLNGKEIDSGMEPYCE